MTAVARSTGALCAILDEDADEEDDQTEAPKGDVRALVGGSAWRLCA